MEYLKCMLLSAATILLMGYTTPVNSSKILAILPYRSRSHYNVMRLVLFELANRGHHLTVLSTQEEKDLPENFKLIQLDIFDPMEYLPHIWFVDAKATPTLFDVLNSTNLIKNQLLLWMGMAYVTKKCLETEKMQNFIVNDNSTFDLILVEDFYFNSYYMFAHKYKAPLVVYTPSSSAHYISKYMGNPLQADYIAHEFFYYFGSMLFWQRFLNTLVTYADLIAREIFIYPSHDRIARDNFKSLPQPLPTMKQLESNISLVLVNSHFSIDAVRSYPPNIVEIAGAHIRPPQPIPEDLKTILDKAEHGFIYFSFGSMLKSSELPKEKIDALLEAFANVKQLILWKWESDTHPNRSENIIFRKWLPQNDILGHPNIRLFITHGGLLSLQEAMYHGVPIVGIPILTDQPLNVAKAKFMGFGEEVNYNTITGESLKNAIDKVLFEPRYAAKAKEVSFRFRDKPQSVLDTAVYWIEYVIRHKGAPHLKLLSSRMTWYEFYMLDIIAFSTLSITFIIYTLRFISRQIISRIKQFRLFFTNQNKQKTN